MIALDIDTPHGPARAHLSHAVEPLAALVLGHGAGGGVGAGDLQVAREVALRAQVSVALVEQPYRVAGRRSAAPAAHLDSAWSTVTAQLMAGPFSELPLVAGGRSSGARVACRTAAVTGAIGVLCLAFPLQPPRRRTGTLPPDRQGELAAVPVPLLVVQGERDHFGMPSPGPLRTVAPVRGTHSLNADLDAVAAALDEWLRELVGYRARA